MKDSPYTNLNIYYLSGTGNALTASRWMAGKAAEKGMHAELYPVDRQKSIENPVSKEKTLIGFCYPTHGFGTPWLMLKFFLRFPRGRHEDVFLSSTRAGSKLSNFFLPGVNGISMWLPLLILLLKGYHVKGMLPIDLPSNWILLHPGYRKKVIDSMFSRCERIVKHFTDEITAGRSFFHYWVFIMLPLDLALVPITIVYQLYGRFFLAKLFVASNKCNACGICYEKCPAHAIRMYGLKPYWTLHCESCMRCINLCPENAIQVSHLLLGMIIITVSSIPMYALIFQFFGFLPIQVFRVTASLLNWGVTLLIYVGVYLIVFFLMKSKPFSLLFEYTSLTRYWRKYRAPGIKTSDFVIKKEGKKN